MINMVHKHIIRDFEYLAVHGKLTLFSVSGSGTSGCIESSAHFNGVPFVFGQMIVIVGIDDCVFALGQRYAAEGIAVSNPAIQEHRKN